MSESPHSSPSNERLYLTFHRNISGYFFEYQSNVLGKFCRHVCGETRNPSIRPSSDKSRNFLGGLFLFQLNTCIISLLVNFQWCTIVIVNKSRTESSLWCRGERWTCNPRVSGSIPGNQQLEIIVVQDENSWTPTKS